MASQWSGGFVAAVTIDNLGDALAGWSLNWNFTAGECVTSAWNGTVTQSGSTATATNAGWNGNVASGGSASFGFQGNGTASVPSAFGLNGTACTGSSGGGGTTTTTTSRPSTTSTSTTSPRRRPRGRLTSTTSRTTTTTSRTSTTTTSAARNTFSNPLKADGADPALQYYNGYYYLSTTTWSTYMNMRRSRTLEGLKTASDTRIWNADNANRGYNFWAPDFQRLTSSNGTRWYYMFSGRPAADLDRQHLVVLESSGDDPMGPYSFKGEPLGTSWGIDGQYLQVNGNLYLLYSAWSGANQNIYIRRMTNPWTVDRLGPLISSPTYNWEKVGGNTNEGPAVLQRNGRTFITYSASSCNTPDYKLGLLTLTGSDPMSASALDEVVQPGLQPLGQQRRLRPGAQLLLQVTRRHRGLVGVPRQRVLQPRLRQHPLHPGAEGHLELRRHPELRDAGEDRDDRHRPRRRAHRLTPRERGRRRLVGGTTGPGPDRRS